MIGRLLWAIASRALGVPSISVEMLDGVEDAVREQAEAMGLGL